MKRIIIFTLFIILSFLFSFAQKETNNWYFGSHACINFSGGAPVAMTNGSLSTTEGSFTIELNEEENIKGVAKIELLNPAGQQIYHSTEPIEKGKFEKEINFRGIKVKNGLYIFKLMINDKVYESKIMIN